MCLRWNRLVGNLREQFGVQFVGVLWVPICGNRLGQFVDTVWEAICGYRLGANLWEPFGCQFVGTV